MYNQEISYMTWPSIVLIIVQKYKKRRSYRLYEQGKTYNMVLLSMYNPL